MNNLISVNEEDKLKACLATTRRLISSLINERLVKCIIKSEDLENNYYHVALLPSQVENNSELVTLYITHELPCHFVKEGTISFCDPEDVLVNLPILVNGKQIESPCTVFDEVIEYVKGASDKTKTQIRSELLSSIEVQELAYSFPRKNPTLSSSTIEWEKAIVEGHATHPMHRTRIGISLEESKSWAAECEGKPEIEFISIPKEQIDIFGPFEEVLKDWKPKEEDYDETRVVLPIHPGQFRILTKMFPDIKKLNETRPSFAQTTIRTVSPVGLPYSIKLALAIQTTSGMRTVSPYSVYNAPIINSVAKALAPPSLFVIEEIASAGSNAKDSDCAKHLACIVRLDPEVVLPQEKHIPCCSLVEKGTDGVPLVISSFSLDTKEKRLEFLDNYSKTFFSSFIPPMLKGLAFEAHGQNTLLRIDSQNNIVGFSVRDFGGVRVHAELAEKNTGVKVSLKEGSAIYANNIEDAYVVFFHAGIQQHIHRLVRALGLHYDSSGWRIVRKNIIPLIKETEVLKYWFKPTIDVKCLFSMRMEGLYRDYLFIEAPNVLVSGLTQEELN